MTKTRYYIEQYNVARIGQAIAQVPAIASCASQHHFVQIAPGLVFGVATFAAEQLNTTWDHKDIFLFPSVQDRKPLRFWIDQQKPRFGFEQVLKDKFDVNVETDSGRDALIKITDHLDHAIFELEH